MCVIYRYSLQNIVANELVSVVSIGFKILRKIQNSVWRIRIKSSKQIREIKIVFDAKILYPFETTLVEINSFQCIVPDFVCLEHSKPLYAFQSHNTQYKLLGSGISLGKKNGTLRIEHMFHGFQLPFVLPSSNLSC